MKLWNELRKQLLKHPGQTVWEGTAKMSYEELLIYAETLAAQLRAERYCILCRSESANAGAILACLAAGKTAIPLPCGSGEAGYQDLLKHVDPPAIITDLWEELSVLRMEQLRPLSVSKPASAIFFLSDAPAADNALSLSDRDLLHEAKRIRRRFALTPGDRLLITRSLCRASVFVHEFLPALLSGCSVDFCPANLPGAALLRLIRANRTTVLCAAPSALASLDPFLYGTADTVRALSLGDEPPTLRCAQIIRRTFPSAYIFSHAKDPGA